MKKIMAVLLCLAVLLSGCAELDLMVRGEVTYEGTTYVTGFYGDLYPQNFSLTEETFTVNDILFRRLEHESFTLYHADVGSYASGTLYCEENQYAEAAAYYSDPENFTYYCAIGPDNRDNPAPVTELTGVDPEKFDALLAFAAQSEHLPFDFGDEREKQTVDLPMPDEDVTPRLRFYKDSNDRLFTTVKNSWYILDGTLYLVYYWDHDYEGDGKLVAVPAPEDLSDYFVEYMKAY